MLQIRDLLKIYPGPVKALAGIDLDIPSGMFGLLGPNGAGKSTLMRILAGLMEPTSGTVKLGDIDVLQQPKEIWRRLGYLPQDFGFYSHLTGEAMLTYLLKLKGVEAPGGMAKLVRELLDSVNLGFAAKRKVKAYSGGMRQRLGIAQAIAGDPELIIVDEPTVGLDPEERLRLYRLLAELAERRTVLLSTHIVDDVAMLCPRFAVLRHGRLLTVTTPEECLGQTAGTIFEGVVASDAMADLAQRYRVTRSVLVAGTHRVRVQQRGGEALPDGFKAVEATLEDAYLAMMRAADEVDDMAKPGDPRENAA